MNYRAAYISFRLSGVGPAFYTKWFWASMLGTELRLAPLILDARVWRSLAALRWDSRAAAGSRHWGDRYVAYLEAMHRWAACCRLVPEDDGRSIPVLRRATFRWNPCAVSPRERHT